MGNTSSSSVTGTDTPHIGTPHVPCLTPLLISSGLWGEARCMDPLHHLIINLITRSYLSSI